MTDQYNGWTNRETWAVFSYISNNEGAYREFLGASAEKLRGDFESAAQESEFLTPGTVRTLLSIGSLWRVNWDEIAKALSSEDSK